MTLAGSLGASCGKKSSADPDEARKVVGAIDEASGVEPAAEPGAPKQEIPGVELGDLSAEGKASFDKLVDSLVSPCGQAMSLRKAAIGDPECRRALYAARYVAFLLAEAASEGEVRELYTDRYVDKKVHQFALDGIPHSGAADAKVVLVEFFDFGCPACRASIPMLEELLAEHEGELVVYYKQFPIEGHANSVAASQAAIAAHRQGKYGEMHEWLLEHPDRQSKGDLFEQAERMGLDMKRFTADFIAADPVVLADKKEGILAGVDGTPTFFINGRRYGDPILPHLLASWIEEEIAVSR